MVTNLLDITFAALWSILLGVGIEYFWRRFVREPRHSIAIAAIVSAGFLAVSLVSHFRRLTPSISVSCDQSSGAVGSQAPGSLDAVLEATTQKAVPEMASIPKSKGLTLVGWAANDDGKQTARGVCLSVDGNSVHALNVVYGANRPDVARALKTPALALSGFKIDVAPNSLPVGTHRLSIVVINIDGSRSNLTSGRAIAVL